MSIFAPGVEAALDQPFVTIFGALKIELPDYTLCLLDGAGVVQFGGDTYVGNDPIYGTLEAIESFSDGVGDQAPALSISLSPSAAEADTLASPVMQGAPVTLWLGVVDPMTGAVVPDPLMLFFGEIDQPRLTLNKGERTLEYECVSAFEHLFFNDEGARLADSFHQTIWPGETGMANVTGVTKKIYWGSEGAKGSATSGNVGSWLGGAVGRR